MAKVIRKDSGAMFHRMRQAHAEAARECSSRPLTPLTGTVSVAAHRRARLTQWKAARLAWVQWAALRRRNTRRVAAAMYGLRTIPRPLTMGANNRMPPPEILRSRWFEMKEE